MKSDSKKSSKNSSKPYSKNSSKPYPKKPGPDHKDKDITFKNPSYTPSVEEEEEDSPKAKPARARYQSYTEEKPVRPYLKGEKHGVRAKRPIAANRGATKSKYNSPTRVHDKVGSDKRNLTPRMENPGQEHLYGLQPVEQALLHRKRKFFQLVVRDEHNSDERMLRIVNLALQAKVPIEKVDLQELNQLCPFGPHQGVVLKCGPLPFHTTSILNHLDKTPSIIVVLDQVEDPQNVGAIVRSCGFFGVKALVVQDRHFCGLTPTVSKTSAGVVEFFPVISVTNIARFLEDQKKRDFWIVGLQSPAEKSLHSLKPDRNIVLVLGNEGKGIRPLVKEACDWCIQIEGEPEVTALNVSNAAAIALFHLSHSAV